MRNKELKQLSEEMLKWDIEQGTNLASNVPFIKDLYCLKNIAHLFIGENESKMATAASMLASAYFYDDDYLDAMNFIDCFAFAYSIRKKDIETAIDWENLEEAADSIVYLYNLPFAPKDWCFNTLCEAMRVEFIKTEDC
jgi:hypothetical protein